MPLTSPIIGASEAPSETVIYASFGSIEITTAELGLAFNSIDISGAVPENVFNSIEITKQVPTQLAMESINIVELDEIVPVLRSLDITTGEGFMALVDVLAEELTGDGGLDEDDEDYDEEWSPELGSGSFSMAEMGAKLVVNGDELNPVAIKSFNFQVPTGKLGSLLNVVLAEPDITVIPPSADIKFAITITINGVEHSKVLMENGKLQERGSKVAYRGGQNDGPIDEVTFGATDIIADAFSRGPRRPVVMFDPGRVKYDEISTDVQDYIRQENGRIIYPVIEPVYGLTMKQILRRAYTGAGGQIFVNGGSSPLWDFAWSTVDNDQQGCGFSSVITNIPDYRVRRADFLIENGWHDGATPVVTMYAPLYFTEGTLLFIIDPDRALPFGANVHTLTLGDHKQLDENIAYKPDTNAVLLTYQYAINDPSEEPGTKGRRQIFTDTTDENGEPGEAGYSKVVTRKWEYEEFSTDDDSQLALYPQSIDIETYQTVIWPVQDPGTNEITYVNHGVRKTHEETSDYTYQGDLMITMRKVTRGLINVGAAGGGLALVDLEQEDVRITWQDDPYNPGSKIQARIISDTKGVVFYTRTSETIQTPSGPQENTVRAIPALLAQSSGMVLSGSIMSAVMVPIRSIRANLRAVTGRQYNMEVVESDFLNNTVKRSYNEPTTASVTTNQFGHKTRTILFRDEDSEAEIGPRIPISVNSFELPRLRAYELARNALHRIKNPLMLMPITLPGVDFTIARGSVVRGQRRDRSFTANFFVTGYTITGQNLGKTGHRIMQTLEAIELLTTT